MSLFDDSKDYYTILGASEDATRAELDRLYRRLAAERHPDRGGDEEEMKSLNEAYGVLKDEATRNAYDAERQQPAAEYFEPSASPACEADALSGRGVETLLCLFAGVALLLIVRAQWMLFLWPLGILAVFMIIAGVLMAHSLMRVIRGTLSQSHPARRYTKAQEALFWSAVGGGGYGLYLVLSNL